MRVCGSRGARSGVVGVEIVIMMKPMQSMRDEVGNIGWRDAQVASARTHPELSLVRGHLPIPERHRHGDTLYPGAAEKAKLREGENDVDEGMVGSFRATARSEGRRGGPGFSGACQGSSTYGWSPA